MFQLNKAGLARGADSVGKGDREDDRKRRQTIARFRGRFTRFPVFPISVPEWVVRFARVSIKLSDFFAM